MSKKGKSPRTATSASSSWSGAFGFGDFAPNSPLSTATRPLDLSFLVPELVVIVKNIQRRDPTTRLKAVQDLQTRIAEGLDDQSLDALLNIWITLYPPLITDFDRQVRVKTHTTHVSLCLAAGKRFSKHLKACIGPWVTSLHDTDRQVSRAALESFNSVFDTEKKREIVWEKYTEDVLKYISDVTQNETAKTISDERFMSSEDMDSRFSLVLCTCLATLTTLAERISKHSKAIEDSPFSQFLEPKLLKKIYGNKDIAVQKSFYRFLASIAKNLPDLAREHISIYHLYISKVLKTPLQSTLNDVMDLIIAASTNIPQIWDDSKDQKSFVDFLNSKLIYRADAEFWRKLKLVLDVRRKNHDIPDIEDIESLCNTLLSSAEQATFTATTVANKIAFEITIQMISDIDDDDIRITLWSTILVPRLRKLLTTEIKSLDNAMFEGLANGLFLLSLRRLTDFSKIWDGQCEFIKILILNKPSDDEKSFSFVSQRWIDLTCIMFSLFAKGNHQVEKSTFLGPVATVFDEVLDVAIVWKGDRQDVMTFVAEILKRDIFVQSLFTKHELKKSRNTLGEFLSEENIVMFLHSPSVVAFLHILVAFIKGSDEGTKIWDTVVKETIPEDRVIGVNNRSSLLAQIMSFATPSLSHKVNAPSGINQNLVAEMRFAFKASISESTETDSESVSDFIDDLFIKLILSRDVLVSDGTAIALLEILFDRLEDRFDHLVSIFTRLCAQDTQFADFILSRPSNTTEISQSSHQPWNIQAFLWKLYESQFGVNPSATNALFNIFQKALTRSERRNEINRGCTVYVKEQIYGGVTLSNLSIEHLVTFCFWLSVSLDQEELFEMLMPFFEGLEMISPSSYPDPSLALTSALGNIFLPFTEDIISKTVSPEYLQSVGRLYFFRVSLLLEEPNLIHALEKSGKDIVLLEQVFLLCAHSKDKLSLPLANALWSDGIGLDSDDFIGFQSDCFELLGRLSKSRCENFIERLKTLAKVFSAEGYYAARILCDILPVIVRSKQVDAAPVKELQEAKTNMHGFLVPALASGYTELPGSKELDLILNGIVSSITGIIVSGPESASAVERDGINKLTLLNTICEIDEMFWSRVKEFRIIMLLRTVLNWPNAALEPRKSWIIATEILRLMRSLLPWIKHVDSDFWDKMMEILQKSLEDCAAAPTEYLPLQHAALKLFGQLSQLQGAADVFQTALWPAKRNELCIDILNLIIAAGESSSDNQPQDLCNSLLRRVAHVIPTSIVGDDGASQLYPLVSLAPKHIREAAYELLTGYIKRTKEEIEIEAALLPTSESANIRGLPDELLSIIVDTDILHLPDDSGTEIQTRPFRQRALEGYLMSWSLIFQHFKDSSFKVRSKYLETLAEGEHVSTLFLIVVREFYLDTERPINLSDLLFEFELEDVENEERKLQGNMAVVFSQALNYASSLIRNEWLDLRDRVLQERVQSYVARYFSSTIILMELATIKKAVEQSEFDDEKIEIRVNDFTKEVTTRYQVDEGQKNEMTIRLPASYPLSEVEIVGTSRVGVNQERWNKWLLTCKIACKNGTIVDALTLFVSNAKAYFANLEECAICYGVLAVDRTLPTKKCPNGHWFHAICLFKWFKTSNGSTCPTCRVTFSVS